MIIPLSYTANFNAYPLPIKALSIFIPILNSVAVDYIPKFCYDVIIWVVFWGNGKCTIANVSTFLSFINTPDGFIQVTYVDSSVFFIILL
jgi:hypothetical protein